MKKLIIPMLALFASSAIAADVVREVTTTRTTVATGKLHEYTPGKTFIVEENTGMVPYSFGKAVAYTSKSGRILTDEQVRTRLRTGVPLWVHYETDAGKRVVVRVELDD